MRNYYYCEANEMIYTENEKENSMFPSARFDYVGSFTNRRSAENNYDDTHFCNFCERNGKRI